MLFFSSLLRDASDIHRFPCTWLRSTSYWKICGYMNHLKKCTIISYIKAIQVMFEFFNCGFDIYRFPA